MLYYKCSRALAPCNLHLAAAGSAGVARRGRLTASKEPASPEIVSVRFELGQWPFDTPIAGCLYMNRPAGEGPSWRHLALSLGRARKRTDQVGLGRLGSDLAGDGEEHQIN